MKTLKTQLTWLFAGALLLSAAPLMAQSIVGSQHDLSTGGTGQNAGAATDQVCVFCHTPHGADESIETVLPLWNRSMTLSTGYTRWASTGTPSFDSAEADIGSISLACLSCHDGTQAMDSVINTPGSGANPGSMGNVTTTTMTGFTNLTQDLRDDHPISIPYAAGGCKSGDTDAAACSATLGDPDFKYPFKDTVNGQEIWWVDTPDGGAVGTRAKYDLPLYSRDVSGYVEPFVECGSCHDPHNESSGGANTVSFLRTQNNAGSKICVACHNK